jgi:isopenicillin-N N-acyltransferase-like protein
MLNRKGVSSTVNLVIGDSRGNIGTIECSPFGNALIPPRSETVCHTNHLYAPDRPEGLKDRASENSFSRLERIYMLSENVLPSFESIRKHLSDEHGTPTAICRTMPPNAVGMQRTETLATIIIDLKASGAEVSLGRPSTLPLIKTLSFCRPSSS